MAIEDKPIPSNLLPLINKMSAAEISILEGAVKQRGSSIMTAAGSANDVLYSEMVKLGWMTHKDHAFDLADRKFLSVSYSPTVEGAKEIAYILRYCLVTRLCRKILPEITQPLRASNAPVADLLILLSNIVVGSISNAFSPELREGAVDRLFELTRARITAKNSSK